MAGKPTQSRRARQPKPPGPIADRLRKGSPYQGKKKPAPVDGLARIPEAAEFLSVGRTTLYALMKCGSLAWQTVGTERRIPWPALHQFVADNATAPDAIRQKATKKKPRSKATAAA